MNKNPFLILFGGIFSLMIAIGIGRFAYTPILPLMQEALIFTDAKAGYLASSNYAGYFVGAILTGVLPLKTRSSILRSSLILSIITTCLMGFSHQYIVMLIIRFISGATSAFIFVLASSIVLDKLAAVGKTNWSGYFYAGVGFGIFFSTLFIPNLNRYFMWEGVWIGLAVVSAILAIFVWLWLKEHSPSTMIKKEEQCVNVQLPPIKWLPYLMIAYGLEGLGYIVTGTFIVAIAENASIFSIDAIIVWTFVGLGAIPSCVCLAACAQKWGSVKSLVFSMIVQSVGIALPALWLSQFSLLLSALLFGATFMGITTLATTLVRQMSPVNSSQIIGYLTAIYALGQMIGPTIAGILLSSTQNVAAVLLGAAGAVFIGAIFLVSGIRYERRLKIEKINTFKRKEGDLMPYVNIKITNENVTAAKKAELIKGATQLLVDVLGKNPNTTVVVIDEVDTDNWGVAGETITARRQKGQ